jgi:hypothetical protein
MTGSAMRLEGWADHREKPATLALCCIYCYDFSMTKEQVKKVLDRVSTWPPERQADLAHIAELMEEQDKSPLRLSDEQVAEVRRRMADPNPKTMTLAEFNERLKRRYGV